MRRILGKLMTRYGVRLLTGGRGKANSDTPPYSRYGWESIYGSLAVKDSDEIWRSWSEQAKAALYGKVATVFACVRAIAMAAQEAPLEIGRMTPQGWKPDENHYLNEVLERPNAEMSQADMVGFMVSNLMLSGWSYTWELRKGGLLSELVPLPSWWCKTIWSTDPASPVAYYEVRQGRNLAPKRILPVDMTMMRFVDPTNIYGARAPLDAALQDVQTDQERANYIIEMLENLKVPGIVLKQPNEFTPEQKADIREALSDLVGKGRRGGPLLLEGEGATAEMLAPLADLDWPGLSALSETRICAVFQVPPIIVHLRAGIDKATYANYETAKRQFYRSTMSAVWKWLGFALTRGLVTNEPSVEDKTLRIRFNTGDIEELQETHKERVERATRLFLSGIITRGRAAEIVGEDKPPDAMADVYVLPLNVVEISASGETMKRGDEGLDAPKHTEADAWDEGATGETEDETDTKTQEERGARGRMRTSRMRHGVAG